MQAMPSGGPKKAETLRAIVVGSENRAPRRNSENGLVFVSSEPWPNASGSSLCGRARMCSAAHLDWCRIWSREEALWRGSLLCGLNGGLKGKRSFRFCRCRSEIQRAPHVASAVGRRSVNEKGLGRALCP